MTCVSLTACRREQHPLASCRDCGVITCRHALDLDGCCWRCERVQPWMPVLARTGQPRATWGAAWLDVVPVGEAMPRRQRRAA